MCCVKVSRVVFNGKLQISMEFFCVSYEAGEFQPHVQTGRKNEKKNVVKRKSFFKLSAGQLN